MEAGYWHLVSPPGKPEQLHWWQSQILAAIGFPLGIPIWPFIAALAMVSSSNSAIGLGAFVFISLYSWIIFTLLGKLPMLFQFFRKKRATSPLK
jgi:hypothetical protein